MLKAEMRKSASFAGLNPSSSRASDAARGASKKANTKCELLLRSRLWQAGCRFRVDVREVHGRPDIVFTKARVAVFCDGDFWHGRNWEERREKLRTGHNAAYWTLKISRNMGRDQENTSRLQEAGWKVLRYWETDILKHTDSVVSAVLGVLDELNHRRARQGISDGAPLRA